MAAFGRTLSQAGEKHIIHHENNMPQSDKLDLTAKVLFDLRNKMIDQKFTSQLHIQVRGHDNGRLSYSNVHSRENLAQKIDGFLTGKFLPELSFWFTVKDKNLDFINNDENLSIVNFERLSISLGGEGKCQKFLNANYEDILDGIVQRIENYTLPGGDRKKLPLIVASVKQEHRNNKGPASVKHTDFVLKNLEKN